MRNAKCLWGICICALILCGIGTFLPFHNDLTRGNTYLFDWKAYRFLLLIIAINLFFVYTKRYIKSYCFISIVLIEVFLILHTIYCGQIFPGAMLVEITCYIFILIFAVLLLWPNWNIAFLINIFIIFVYVNSLGLYYYHHFSIAIHQPLLVILFNKRDIFKYRGIGYFICNTGVIIAIISVLISLVFSFFNKGKKQVHCLNKAP